MIAEAYRLRYEDYLRMPEDGNKYEIIQGELFVTPPPSTDHQRVSRGAFRKIDAYVEEHNLGEVFYAPFMVRLTPDEPVEPDLVYVRKNRLEIIDRAGINGAPDLVIEILSPNKPQYDRVTKFNRYLQVGVPEYWILDPKSRTAEQFALEEGKYSRMEPTEEGVIGSRVIDGLRLILDDIFGPVG